MNGVGGRILHPPGVAGRAARAGARGADAAGQDAGNGARRRPKTADGLGPGTDAGQEFATGRPHAAGRPAPGPAGGGLRPLRANPRRARTRWRRPAVERRERAARGAGRRHRRLFEPRTVATRWRSRRASITAIRGRSRVRRHTDSDDRRQRPAGHDGRPARGAAGALRAGRGGRLLRGARRLARRERRRRAAGARAHRARAGSGGARSGPGRRAGREARRPCARWWARRCACSATSTCGRATRTTCREGVTRWTGQRGSPVTPRACGVLRLARVRGAVAARGRRRHELVAVVSQPDRPAGRGQAPTPPAVKVAAAALGVPVIQPEKLRTPEAEATLAAFGADLFVVVAYGRILPQRAARSAAARAVERARVAAAQAARRRADPVVDDPR